MIKELEAARAAATAAAQLVLDYYARLTPAEFAPANVTTDADRRAQEIIFRILAEHFPADAFLGEERTDFTEQFRHHADRLWIVDPIDGTRGFVMKNGEFAIMVGLVEQGEARLGLVLEPVANRLTWAVRGQGCWVEEPDQMPVRCHVSEQTQLSQATLVRSRAEQKSGPHPLLPTPREIYTYSAGRKLAMVARGQADVYASLFRGFRAWDVCAGHVLILEAGGVVTDGLGRPLHYQDPSQPIVGLIAANPDLHGQALAQLRPRLLRLLEEQPKPSRGS